MIDDGVALVDFARTAHHRFETLPISSKRRALNLVLSNCSFANGELTTTFRKPFDLLEKIGSPDGGDVPPGGASTPENAKMAPLVGDISNFFRLPTVESRQLVARYRAAFLDVAS
ncbi:hypothetical protein [Sphingomonas panacis]|uniref:hypothetical protein n=1 Tax=Sphingomonas panacis TaxID=1560345 RepID=UPI0012376B57|nr:hypothetical protein [Sphingomonas panacis]